MLLLLYSYVGDLYIHLLVEIAQYVRVISTNKHEIANENKGPSLRHYRGPLTHRFIDYAHYREHETNHVEITIRMQNIN